MKMTALTRLLSRKNVCNWICIVTKRLKSQSFILVANPLDAHLNDLTITDGNTPGSDAFLYC